MNLKDRNIAYDNVKNALWELAFQAKQPYTDEYELVQAIYERIMKDLHYEELLEKAWMYDELD